VLVVMKPGMDILPGELLFDVEAFRRFDVLQFTPPKWAPGLSPYG